MSQIMVINEKWSIKHDNGTNLQILRNGENTNAAGFVTEGNLFKAMFEKLWEQEQALTTEITVDTEIKIQPELWQENEMEIQIAKDQISGSNEGNFPAAFVNCEKTMTADQVLFHTWYDELFPKFHEDIESGKPLCATASQIEEAQHKVVLRRWIRMNWPQAGDMLDLSSLPLDTLKVAVNEFAEAERSMPT